MWRGRLRLSKAWMRETTLWVSASATMAERACCACRRTGAPPVSRPRTNGADAVIRTKALAAKAAWGEGGGGGGVHVAGTRFRTGGAR